MFIYKSFIMRKRVFISVCFIFSVLMNFAQTKTVTGIIKDDKGAIVPYAVVQIKGTNKGINADSLGNFSITAKSNTVLLINAMGYETATVSVKDQNNLSVILKTASVTLNNVSIEGQTAHPADDYSSRKIATDMIQDFVQVNGINGFGASGSGLPNMYSGAALPVFSHKDETKGSKYLFDQGVRGSATNANNRTVSNEGYWFNYDKMSRNLLVTLDKATVVEINKNDLNSFTFINKDKSELVFEKIPLIDASTFFIQLLKDNGGYSLYKLLKTKFIRANYHSTGLTETGNNYDEYVDEYAYYIVFPGGKQFSAVELKKKSIKEVLIKEDKKVKSFFSQHGNDELDEFFLIALVASLNHN